MGEKLRYLLRRGAFNGKTGRGAGRDFKPNPTTLRDAPSLTIVPALVGGGARVRVVDPQGRREGETLLPVDPLA